MRAICLRCILYLGSESAIIDTTRKQAAGSLHADEGPAVLDVCGVKNTFGRCWRCAVSNHGCLDVCVRFHLASSC